MIKVRLTAESGWASKIVIEEFGQWCEANSIKWKVEFSTTPGDKDTRDYICFEQESDAMAFRLRYGI